MRIKPTTFCFVILLAMGTTCYAQNQTTKGSNDKAKTNEKSTQSGMTKDNQSQSNSTNNGNAAMPYKAGYSSQFRMNGQKYSPVVLNAWKGYDANSFEGMSGILADTAMAILPDGTVIRGKDNFLSGIKAYRGGFTSVQSYVAAYMDFTSIDKNEDWVGIWGSETGTKSDGTKQTVVLHELWRFNKDGKVTLMRQFVQQEPRSSK